MKDYVIGIDQGTQSTKSILIDASGNILGRFSQPVALSTPRPGWVEQDVEELFQSVITTMSHAVRMAGVETERVKAIAVTSQICSLVSIDKDWEVVGPLISHLDTRSLLQRDLMLAQWGDEIMRQNGQNPYIAPRLKWLKEQDPETYSHICRALLVNGYIAGRLAGLKGEEAFVDTTCMGVYGWGDIRSNTWDRSLAERLGIDVELSPRPVSPWQIIGVLNEEDARQCGLAAGIPIAAGLGDAIAGWIGVGAVKPGILVDTSGTANHLGICVDHYQPDTTYGVLSHYPSAIQGQWYPIGFTAGTGRSHSWFIDELILGARGFSGEELSQAYTLLEEEASRIAPGSEGLLFSPHFDGRMCPYQPNVRGAWVGLTWKHSRGHLYRAILESIAFEYYTFLEVARKLYPDLRFNQVLVIGGGARSRLWNEIKANVLGLPYMAYQSQDYAVLGAAIIAGYAVGVFSDLSKPPRRFHKILSTIEPSRDVQDRYRAYAERYARFFKLADVIFDDLWGQE
jgi:xylulokinase